MLGCLQKDPARRPHDARELVDRLDSTGLAEKWTQAQARAWWTRHGATLGALRNEQVEAASERVLPVDFRRLRQRLRSRPTYLDAK